MASTMQLSLENVLYLALLLVASFLLRRILEYRRLDHFIEHHSGTRSIIGRGTGILNILPHIPWLFDPGMRGIFRDKRTRFSAAGCDILSSMTLFPLHVTHVIADADATKTITSSRTKFPKPVEQYKILSFFGPNIVASEGEEWKRYRKISSPAFSNRNNQLVWDETVNVMMDLFNNVWGDQDMVVVDHCLELTLPIALFVIGVAGFGRKMVFQDDSHAPPGHDMTFKDALNVVSNSAFTKLMVPNWAFGMTPHLRRVRLGFSELESYMLEMIGQRKRTSEKEQRWDLFSSLVDANDEDNGEQAKLDDSELMGNIFIFLLAGHETTAHTLCFTLALLAIYPEEQDALFQHIKSVIPDHRLPSYGEMNMFTRSMAVLYETLRMFPPVTVVPKCSAEDTTLLTTNHSGEQKVIIVPGGASILLNIPALHYNERYWKDPHTFSPSRFLQDWPRDAFAPFSLGSRACMGRRFFETESIAILTMLVSRYEIKVKPDPRFAAETTREQHDRILNAAFGLTLTPIEVPLVFHRRTPSSKPSLV